MEFITFSEFLAQESSPYSRARANFVRGTGVPVFVGSKSTPSRQAISAQAKANKKRKKRKSKKSPPLHKEVDKWLNSVDGLKRDLDKLAGIEKDQDKKEKQKPEPKKPNKPEEKLKPTSLKTKPEDKEDDKEDDEDEEEKNEPEDNDEEN